MPRQWHHRGAGQAGGWLADFGAAITLRKPRCWRLSLGWFGAEAGAQCVSRFGILQERPRPCDGTELTGRAQGRPKVNHPKTPSGPGMGNGTRTTPQCPRHRQVRCYFSSKTSPPPSHDSHPGDLIFTLQTPTDLQPALVPQPSGSGMLPGHPQAPRQDAGRGNRMLPLQRLNSQDPEQISDVLRDKSCRVLGSEASADWETSPPPC